MFTGLVLTTTIHYTSACVNNNADVMHALVAMGGRGQRME